MDTLPITIPPVLNLVSAITVIAAPRTDDRFSRLVAVAMPQRHETLPALSRQSVTAMLRGQTLQSGLSGTAAKLGQGGIAMRLDQTHAIYDLPRGARASLICGVLGFLL